MNAPKKIWFDIEECSAGPVKFNDDEIPYIRADIVDALAEALKAILGFAYAEHEGELLTIQEAKTALAKLEESHD